MKFLSYFKKVFFFVIIILLSYNNSNAQQVTLKGHVLEINSNRKPIANAQIKSDDGANTVLSNTNGTYTLKFQDKGYGGLVYIEVAKQEYELVNKKEMELFLPNEKQKQEIQLEIILCKKGYLEQARKKILRNSR